MRHSPSPLQNVSRETFDALGHYVSLLQQWNQRINLIASSTEHQIWSRHIEDSAQLHPYVKSANNIIDIGSGAGFPGLVLAVFGCKHIHLVESDKRKGIFLKECVRELSLNEKVTVHDRRVEDISSLQCDIVVSRACASLSMLFGYALPHMEKNARCFFLKGKNVSSEIKIASDWRFDYTLHGSIIDNEGVVLEVVNLEKKA